MADYIIVGGGSTGSTIASRLSEDPDASVVLFEQGPSDWNPYIHLPVTYYKTSKGKLLSRYRIEPQQGQNGASPEFVQARVLGGGSSVNAMVYIRGCPEDYDTWEAEGAQGWGYKDVLPYFKRAEDNERFSGEVHGQGGPLGVSDIPHVHYLTKAWIKSCQEMGIPYNPDFNSGDQSGCGFYQVTMRDGRRCSAAVAYLNPARKRGNLKIRTGHKVTRIVIENGRAVGVEFIENNRRVVMRAEREVIVCSGAIGSPHLLQVSGIGPAGVLADAGVKVEVDLPGVGANLQDHLDMIMIYDLNGPHSYDKYKKLHWQLWAGLQYGLFRQGPVASNVCEGGLFWYGDKEDKLPNLQYHFLPGAGIEAGADSAPSGNGCTLNVYQTRPRSRGWVRIRSGDAFQPPAVNPNYLGDPYDLDCMAEAVRIGQEIMQQKSIRKFVGSEYRPGKILRTHEERKEYVIGNAQGALHPSGTCRMGSDDMAVVDTQLRVRGVDGLRVADVSVMPRLVSGNTNAPAIMIGERTSDFIRGNRI